MLACQVGDVAEAQKLIAQGAPVNTAGSNHGITPLLLASMRSVELVKLLLDHGAQVNLADADGFTPINDACYTGKADNRGGAAGRQRESQSRQQLRQDAADERRQPGR